MTRILIFGAGRMAHSILSVADQYRGVTIVGVVFHDASEVDGHSTTPFFDSLDSAVAAFEEGIDLVIDFSLARGTSAVARWCEEHGIALLSGVTGIDSKTHADLDSTSRAAPVLWAPNLSFGVNLMAGLMKQLGPAIGSEPKITVEETHHAGKKDAPSGTALFLAEQLGVEQDITFHSIREGDVIGEHSVTIELPDETLTVTHVAGDRRLFARGALEAGQWLVGQSPGRYSASDWISGVISARKMG